MRVYRVENEQGEGPYKHTIRKNGQRIGAAHWDDAHPGPTEDGLDWAVFGYEAPFSESEYTDKVFGTNSLESLLAWFDGWWDVLERHGYSAEEYEVPDECVAVGIGGEQVVFMRSRAEHLI